MSNISVFDEKMLLAPVDQDVVVADYIPESRSCIKEGSISGQIIGASSDEGYKRLWIRKLYDKLAYGTRMSNVVQTIIVRCQDGVVDRDVQILCYGRLNGGVNALRTGSEVAAEGKFDGKNRFIAKRMSVGNAEIEIKTEIADIMVYAIPIIILMVVMLWNPLIAIVASSDVGEKLSALALPFAGGLLGTMHMIKKTSKRFIPFTYRFKAGLAVGVLSAMLVAILFH